MTSSIWHAISRASPGRAARRAARLFSTFSISRSLLSQSAAALRLPHGLPSGPEGVWAWSVDEDASPTSVSVTWTGLAPTVLYAPLCRVRHTYVYNGDTQQHVYRTTVMRRHRPNSALSRRTFPSTTSTRRSTSPSSHISGLNPHLSKNESVPCHPVVRRPRRPHKANDPLMRPV